MLMIKCPRTGRGVSTGILTDPYSYLKTPSAMGRTRFPHCGLEHAWSCKDAWLAAEKLPEASHDNRWDQRQPH
jgi:hypothetical protein